MKRFILITVLSVMFSVCTYAKVFSFSTENFSDWKEKSFVGHTDYQLVNDGRKKVLYAKSSNAASGLYMRTEIDLGQTPTLSWRWKVNQLGQGNDELTKQGDDYPVRLYLVASSGIKFWQNYSIVYVWSNTAKINDSWSNPYTDKVKHIAVDSGQDYLGEWRNHHRNVKADFSLAFGVEPTKIKSIAIMTDSDNSMQSFESWYGDIQFD